MNSYSFEKDAIHDTVLSNSQEFSLFEPEGEVYKQINQYNP